VAQLYVTALGGSPRALRGFATKRAHLGAVAIFDIQVALEELKEFQENTGLWQLTASCLREVGTSSDLTVWSREVRLIEST